jgi:hypothetical protein
MIESQKSIPNITLIERVKLMIKESKELNQVVYTYFNGIKILVDKDSLADLVVFAYKKEMEELLIEFKYSTEYKKAFIKFVKEKEIIHQESLDKADLEKESFDKKLAELSSIDSSDHLSLLNWIISFSHNMGDEELNTPLRDSLKIINALSEKGYHSQTHKKYKESDSQGFAKHIVGKAIDSLICLDIISEESVVLAKKWKNEFS